MIRSLIDANVGFLEQALELLGEVDEATYVAAPVPGLSSAGAHLRHVLDHYAALLDGAADGSVDYDRRRRGTAVEQDRVAAAVRTRDLMSRLLALPEDGEFAVAVQTDCGQPVGSARTRSSVGRELQFLVSHTVHHFALIRAVLAGSRVSLPDDFGVAPSTLAYRTRSACAP